MASSLWETWLTSLKKTLDLRPVFLFMKFRKIEGHHKDWFMKRDIIKIKTSWRKTGSRISPLILYIFMYSRGKRWDSRGTFKKFDQKCPPMCPSKSFKIQRPELALLLWAWFEWGTEFTCMEQKTGCCLDARSNQNELLHKKCWQGSVSFKTFYKFNEGRPEARCHSGEAISSK